jgi:hypothetical protein
LIQMGARWYDSDLGRFTQPDSIIPHPGNPQSFNRYSYVLNNPAKYTDPTGHSPIEVDTEGNDYIDTAWRAKERVYEETGIIIIGQAKISEIRMIQELIKMFPAIKGSVVAVSRQTVCPDRCIEGSTNVPSGNIHLFAGSIQLCAGSEQKCPGEQPRNYSQRFRWAAAHELAHSVVLENPTMRDEYSNIRFGEIFPEEPTTYGQWDPMEGIAEFVALSVTDPSKTEGYDRVFPWGHGRYPWDPPNLDLGKERREFVRRYFPNIPGVPN